MLGGPGATQDAAATGPPPAPPAIKRPRRAFGLGEQERRERKRALDREAQRSLREKTKTYIAELERTIGILRDQSQHPATRGLLSEIDILREENDRLRNVIASVRGAVGDDVFGRGAGAAAGAGGGGVGDASPVTSSMSM